jgi:hypothetical protein
MGGKEKKRKSALHHDLDRLIGVWSLEEATSFDRALEEQRKIETSLKAEKDSQHVRQRGAKRADPSLHSG